ncbi:MAG: alpha/beta hydrolase [Thermoleophilaceae bacterium]|nr:alpha/beta hydrolase [Thermoleophilaceae bacterium]
MPTDITTHDGVKLNIEDTGGDGRPVVLIHGWPLSGESWSHQIGPLADAGYRVITYDRRGFGASDKPDSGYDYDTFAADLGAVLDGLGLKDATLVGFSMGGGEVARYLGSHGSERVSEAVFAAAVPPFLLKTDDNPDGGLDEDTIEGWRGAIAEDRDGFMEEFSKGFFSAGDELKVSEEERQEAKALSEPASLTAFRECVTAFGTTDFRGDLEKIDVRTLVIHGDSDATVPVEISGKRTAEMVDGAELEVIEGGPHGLNASHADEFNSKLITFMA